jgi:adenylate cyclase
MAIEIERKFLVRNDGWRAEAGPGRRIRQGYVARQSGVTVRVRRIGELAFLALKGARQGISRLEFEYEVPAAEAEAMLRDLCPDPPIEKVRHDVPHAGLMWEVDVFEGRHAGLIMADVELARPDQAVSLPAWVGAEVTDDPRFRSAMLAAAGAPHVRSLAHA